MLLSSEDSIRTELGILLSSGPSTCLNSNKLFLFSIIMMKKTAGAGKCAFEMIFFCGCRLHTTKNISPSPTLQFGSVFYIDVDQGSLINKKNWKIALACLFFCGGCADMMPFSTNLCKKKPKRFYSNLIYFKGFGDPKRSFSAGTTSFFFNNFFGKKYQNAQKNKLLQIKPVICRLVLFCIEAVTTSNQYS